MNTIASPRFAGGVAHLSREEFATLGFFAVDTTRNAPGTLAAIRSKESRGV